MRWIAFILACATVALGATLLWSTAKAQQGCLPLPIAERVLERDHGERLIAVGRIGSSAMRFYANQATRTWTALRITPQAQACSIASGTDLDFARPAPVGRGS